jgi:hypothetical protein
MLFGLIPTILLAIFALLTIRNMHRPRTRIVPLTVDKFSNVNHRKNQQLIRMLLTEICICIIFGFIHPSVLLYSQITQYNIKSLQLITIEQLCISVSTFILHIPYCVSFYMNLIASETFRGEVKNLIWNHK